MNIVTFPSIDLELLLAIKESLAEGETISSFIEQSIRDSIERRRRSREFLTRGFAARSESTQTGIYASSDSVVDRLEQMLLKARAR